MKLATPRWRPRLVLTGILLLAVLVAPTVLIASTAGAVPPSATASVSPTSTGAGTTASYTYTLAQTSGQTGSFNLTAPTGWSISSLTPPVPAGVTLFSPTEIRGRGVTVNSSPPLTVLFTAQAPCVTGASTTWQTVAKVGDNFNGGSVNVNGVTASLSGTCSSEFVSPPANAAFNANTNGPSENITSAPFTPGGTSIQAIVLDDDDRPRPGTSVTLQLTTNPHGATLAGSTTAVTDSSGHATFPGSPNAITLNRIGQGYKMTPRITGTTVGTEQTAPFGIYQEGEACSAGNSCEVRGRATDISAAISATPTGDAFLGAFVVAEGLVDCTGYTEITDETIVWIYTGTDTQTVTVLLSKQAVRRVTDRGSAHIDICYQTDPHPITGELKTFTDKFGVVTSGPALLPDCTPAITTNCIVSQNATPGGGRRVIFVVEDGKGRP